MIFNNYIKTIEKEMIYDINTIDNTDFFTKYFSSITDINYNSSLYNDLEILKDINKINNTKTYFGFLYFKTKLSNPSCDINKLLFNKKNILLVSKKYNLFNEKLEIIKKVQNSIIHIFDTKFTKNKHIESLYFNDYLEYFNTNETVLNYYNMFNMYFPLYNIIAPIILLVLPIILKNILSEDFFINNKFMLNILFLGIPDFNFFNISDFKTLFTKCISVLFFFYNLYISIKLSYHTNYINKHIKTMLNGIKTIISTTQTIYDMIGKNLKYHTLEKTSIIQNLDKIDINNNGQNLVLYKKIILNKEDFLPYIKFIAYIDYLTNINYLINNNFTLVNYEASKEPKLILKEFKHPFLDNSVSNNIDMTRSQNSQNIIITGPNASGKSTIIKALTLNIILAQTIGISFSQKMILTPFKNIYGYLTKTDTLGKQSLFQTELKNLGDYIKLLKNNEFSFLIVDEILNSTNHHESTKISSAICKKLNSSKNNISIITSHNTILTNLEKTNDSINYKMELNTYKLKKGQSTDLLGIKMLKTSNFDKEIIDSIKN